MIRALPLLLLVASVAPDAAAAPLDAPAMQALLGRFDEKMKSAGDFTARAYIETKEKDKPDVAYDAVYYRHDADDRFLILFLAPGLALAQHPGGMNHEEMMRRFSDPAAMQKMAAQAEAAQKCMKDIDQKKIDALQKRAEAAGREIERLCEAGKRDEALSKGLDLYREMSADPTVTKLRECTKDMAETMRQMMPNLPGANDEPEPTERDICS